MAHYLRYAPTICFGAHYTILAPAPTILFILLVTILTSNFKGLLTSTLSGLGPFTFPLVYLLLAVILYRLAVVYTYPVTVTLCAIDRMLSSCVPIRIHRDHDVRIPNYYVYDPLSC